MYHSICATNNSHAGEVGRKLGDWPGGLHPPARSAATDKDFQKVQQLSIPSGWQLDICYPENVQWSPQ